ncbi:MAG: hypothetical protein RL154_1341 [Pseudomonadota bacterium]
MNKLITLNDIDNNTILGLFDRAQEFLKGTNSTIGNEKLLINIFFENSTRTRSSFEVAAKRIGMNVANLDVATSSTSKGETLFDTAANLDAMGPSIIVVRHKSSGVPGLLSNYTKASIVNGGDGAHAHPTQALLDLFTMRQYIDNLEGKTIAIVGDVTNSRVANSNIELLPRFGLKVLLCAPPHFMPKTDLQKTHSLKEAVERSDIIMCLRTQTERHKTQNYASLKDYAKDYCLTKEIVGDKNILALHPGPVNRNVDISDDFLADERCKVLEQVQNGVAIRMAVLEKILADIV